LFVSQQLQHCVVWQSSVGGRVLHIQRLRLQLLHLLVTRHRSLQQLLLPFMDTHREYHFLLYQ
jgi:hypothetical protein